MIQNAFYSPSCSQPEAPAKAWIRGKIAALATNANQFPTLFFIKGKIYFSIKVHIFNIYQNYDYT